MDKKNTETYEGGSRWGVLLILPTTTKKKKEKFLTESGVKKIKR